MMVESRKGFTLLELLVVIAIIAILFAVVLIAVNPTQRFKDTRNARRESDVQSILNATLNYTADRKGTLPPNLPDEQCVGTRAASNFGGTPPAGAKAYWQLTDATDTTGGTNTVANNLALEGATITPQGRFGNGLSINGIRQDATAPDEGELQLTQPLSLEAWILLSASFDQNRDAPMGIVDKGDYQLFLDNRTGTLTLALNPATDPAFLAYAGNAHGFMSFAEYKGKLYAGQGNVAGEGKVYESADGASWTPSGFPGTEEIITSLAVYKGKLYAGQGSSSGDGRVFSYDGTTNDYGLGANGWRQQIATGRDVVYSLTVWNGKLYAGVGGTAVSAEVYEYDGASWRILYLASAHTNDAVYALAGWNGALYAGTGGANHAQVWRWNGSIWTQSTTWPTKGEVYALAPYRRDLFAGIGGGTDNTAEVWRFDGASWISSDTAGASKLTLSLTVYEGKLYAGLGGSIPADRKVRVFDGTSWLDFYTGSVPNDNAEHVQTLYTFNGKLYAGESGDNSAPYIDGDILSFGNTTLVRSAKRTWQANTWYHVTATHDGITAILYVNGHEDARATTSVIPGTHTIPLYMGYDHGNGFFAGTLDNVILYNAAVSATDVANHAGCYDLAASVVPGYLAKLPEDPVTGSGDGLDTGYRIALQASGTIAVSAPGTEITANQQSIINVSR